MIELLATATQQSPQAMNAAEMGAAEMGGFAGAVMGGFFAIIIVIGLAILALGIVLLWLIYDAAKAASPQHQTMNPSMVWLLLIPFWNVYWNFKALPAVTKSLSATLRDKGIDQQGKDASGLLAGKIFAWTVVFMSIIEVISWITHAPPAQGGLSDVQHGIGWIGFFAFAFYLDYVIKVSKAKKLILSAEN